MTDQPSTPDEMEWESVTMFESAPLIGMVVYSQGDALPRPLRWMRRVPVLRRHLPAIKVKELSWHRADDNDWQGGGHFVVSWSTNGIQLIEGTAEASPTEISGTAEVETDDV